MHPVILHGLGRDGADDFIAQERQKVNLEPEGMAFDIFGAALACGQDAVFRLELGGGVLEGRAFGEVAGPLADLKV
jgi:hypothetical protein